MLFCSLYLITTSNINSSCTTLRHLIYMHLLLFSIATISCTELVHQNISDLSTDINTTEGDTTTWKPAAKKSNTTMIQRCGGYYFDDLILIKRRRKPTNSTKRACSTVVHFGILDDLIYIEEPSDKVAAAVTDLSDFIDFKNTTVLTINTDFQIALNAGDNETGTSTNFTDDSDLQTTTKDVDTNTAFTSNDSIVDHTNIINLGKGGDDDMRHAENTAVV